MVEETVPSEVADRLDDDALALLDIRDPDSFAEGHIPGAENVPANHIDRSVLEREWPDEVVVSCYLGKSSKRVAADLDRHLDSDVSSLAGGFDEWDGPVATGD
jgi:thiosulfate sulfurtransferase